ncbi:MAG: alpha/beta hydrolase [Thermoleophilia bacterium]|nr:alpha/beta hydrolase [Thermoleophilia bacterium]
MTAAGATHPLALAREWGGETLVFRGATAVALVHALDDAFFHRQPGVPLGQHALAAAVTLAAGVGAGVAFPRLRPGLRAGVALVFGVFATVNGAMHVAHVAVAEIAGSDLTGVLAVAAGAVLLGLGVVVPLRHRGERAATRRRRWARRVVAVLAGALLAYAVVLPAALAIALTHKYREPIGQPPSAAYEPVALTSADGLRLSGWYRPSGNGAAVILVHGGGGDRTGAVRHAELLARHGYGVLLYDARGRGESEGSPTGAPGWGWENDVAGALAFVRERRDVEPGRIGALGLSTGAHVLIEVAAERRDLRAVVADGTTARSFADYRNLQGIDSAAPYWWSLYTAARVLSGAGPGAPLVDLVRRVSPTPLLLIAAGRGVPLEREVNRLYAEAAREPFEMWDLPDVGHTAAIRERPAEYERRVVGFFDRALGRRDP